MSGASATGIGSITSASDLVEINLTGPGGHTARPDLTVNLIDVVGRLSVELPRLVSERVAHAGPVRLVFGIVQAGDAANVIPNRAMLRGSIRTPVAGGLGAVPRGAGSRPCTPCWRPRGPNGRCATSGGWRRWTTTRRPTQVLVGAAEQIVGRERISQAEQSWGGDSFGWFTREVAGSYLRLGTHNPQWTERHELHHASFQVDERAIAIASKILTHRGAGRGAALGVAQARTGQCAQAHSHGTATAATIEVSGAA